MGAADPREGGDRDKTEAYVQPGTADAALDVEIEDLDSSVSDDIPYDQGSGTSEVASEEYVKSVYEDLATDIGDLERRLKFLERDFQRIQNLMSARTQDPPTTAITGSADIHPSQFSDEFWRSLEEHIPKEALTIKPESDDPNQGMHDTNEPSLTEILASILFRRPAAPLYAFGVIVFMVAFQLASPLIGLVGATIFIGTTLHYAG